MILLNQAKHSSFECSAHCFWEGLFVYTMLRNSKFGACWNKLLMN